MDQSFVRKPWLLLPVIFSVAACGRTSSALLDDAPDTLGGASVEMLQAPADAQARAAAAIVAYDDKPINGFVDGGWGTYTLQDKTHVYSGAYAMKLTPTNYDGVQLQHQGGLLAAGTYLAVDFWVYGSGQGGQQLWVGVTGSPSGTYTVPVNNYIQGGKIPAGQWTHVVAPISAMGASHVAINSVYVMAAIQGTQSAVWVDEVTLTTVASSGANAGGGSSTTGTATSSTTGNTTTTTAGGSTTTTTTAGGGTTTATTTGGNTTTTTAGGSSTTTTTGSGGTTTGGASAAGRESWAWLYYDYATSYTAIAANANAFTHISPTFYSLNYDYSSGVAYFTTCDYVPGTYNCSDKGTNNFTGYTTQSFTAAMTKLGIKTVPAIYAGAANGGTDQGALNLLNNTATASNLITAMVAEAVSNGYAGYNLDWELSSSVGSAYADKFITFVNNFKAALKPYGMSLSVDVIVSNINGTWCSGNDGVYDFAKLSTSSIDRVIIEDYTSTLGTASNTCQSTPLSSTSPVVCPVNSSGSDVLAMGLINFMCSNLPSSMVVIGMESYSSGTNPIAGAVMTAIQNYGITKVALWPQSENGYPFLSSKGLVANQSDWYSILRSFLSSK